MKAKDTTTSKEFDNVCIADNKQEYKDLVEQLVSTLQNSMGDVLSQPMYESIIDNAANKLYTMTSYATSLIDAITEINNLSDDNGGDSGETDVDELNDLADIADALVEGVERTTQYLDVVRSFGSDIDAIQSELYSKLQNLHSN